MATAGPVSDDQAYNNYDPGWTSTAPPFDSRFPHQNQRSNCLRNYVDYHRCRKVKGEDYVNCNYFKKVYVKKCSTNVTEKWDEQMEKGTFPYRL